MDQVLFRTLYMRRPEAWLENVLFGQAIIHKALITKNVRRSRDSFEGFKAEKVATVPMHALAQLCPFEPVCHGNARHILKDVEERRPATCRHLGSEQCLLVLHARKCIFNPGAHERIAL